MIKDNEHPEQDPVEGSREVIERDLERQGDKRTDGEGQPGSPLEPESGQVEEPDDKKGNLIINPAADGTRIVPEPANDWPADSA